MSNLKPLFDKVLIERETLQTSTSIILPDDINKRNAPSRGIVVAIGPDTEQVEVGQKVIFGMHAGSWIKDDNDDEVYVCLDTDILCIVGE